MWKINVLLTESSQHLFTLHSSAAGLFGDRFEWLTKLYWIELQLNISERIIHIQSSFSEFGRSNEMMMLRFKHSFFAVFNNIIFSYTFQSTSLFVLSWVFLKNGYCLLLNVWPWIVDFFCNFSVRCFKFAFFEFTQFTFFRTYDLFSVSKFWIFALAFGVCENIKISLLSAKQITIEWACESF